MAEGKAVQHTMLDLIPPRFSQVEHGVKDSAKKSPSPSFSFGKDVSVSASANQFTLATISRRNANRSSHDLRPERMSLSSASLSVPSRRKITALPRTFLSYVLRNYFVRKTARARYD